MAKQHGAYVLATARAYNHEFVRQLGADEVIDYTTTDFCRSSRHSRCCTGYGERDGS
ncbi:hypothetical protein ACFTAO_11775 [Paenibacillus rhizoplanae]